MWIRPDQPFTATLVGPAGIERLNLGARIEVPVTRAIVCYWRPATRSGIVWSVDLDAPPTAPRGPGNADPLFLDALRAGAFQIVWMDDAAEPVVEIFVPLWVWTGAGDGWPGDGVDWPPPDLDAVTPTVDDVMALLRTRTYEDGVVEQPTATDLTRPPHDEVQALIERAVPVVLSQLRPRFPDTLYGEVRHAIALYVAVLVEGSYFREQLAESQVALYRDLYLAAVAGITGQIDLLLADVQPVLRLA